MAVRKKTRKQAVRKTVRRNAAPKTKRVLIPYYGAEKKPAPKKRRSIKKVLSKDYIIENLTSSGMVALGGMGANAISSFIPIKQPMAKQAINIIAGLVVSGIAGKNKKLALAGAGMSANGMIKLMQTAFPTIPYLSGEDVDISIADVQRAIESGAVSVDEGTALIDAMSGNSSEDSDYLMGASMDYSGEIQNFAGEYDDFQTAE